MPDEPLVKVGYSTRQVIGMLALTVVNFPETEDIAAKAIDSIAGGALVSTDTLDFLYRMTEHEMAGMNPWEALQATREEFSL